MEIMMTSLNALSMGVREINGIQKMPVIPLLALLRMNGGELLEKSQTLVGVYCLSGPNNVVGGTKLTLGSFQ